MSTPPSVDVYLTPRAVSAEALKGRVVVVVDVLRASSTIITALHHGARAVVPVADMADAGKIASGLDPDTSLLGGEREGRPIDGYAAGNSPLEYVPERVAGRTVVLNTTNGTGALTHARGAAQVAVGAFLNAGRVVDFLREALAGGASGAILCAGHNGDLALEDLLCAGMLLHRLWGDDAPDTVSDGAHVALTQYRHDQHRLARALFGCTHTQRLIGLGYGDDVAFCARIDATPVLPLYRDSRITLARAPVAPAAPSEAGRVGVAA